MAVFRCGLRSGLRCRVGFWIIPRGRRGARRTGVARVDVGRGQSSLGGSRVRTPYSPPVRPRRALSFHFWAHLVTMKRWRVDRVAEGVGLENQCVSNGTKGSNPLLSATSGKENPGTVEVPGFFCSHRPPRHPPRRLPQMYTLGPNVCLGCLPQRLISPPHIHFASAPRSSPNR